MTWAHQIQFKKPKSWVVKVRRLCFIFRMEIARHYNILWPKDILWRCNYYPVAVAANKNILWKWIAHGCLQPFFLHTSHQYIYIYISQHYGHRMWRSQSQQQESHYPIYLIKIYQYLSYNFIKLYIIDLYLSQSHI